MVETRLSGGMHDYFLPFRKGAIYASPSAGPIDFPGGVRRYSPSPFRAPL
jgi:hypothetical protein